jgi:hypothetical protein
MQSLGSHSWCKSKAANQQQPKLIRFSIMNLSALLSSFIPVIHFFKDEEHRFNLGATWVDNEGLKDYHNLELRYVRNSERLALINGSPQPDGSWAYVETEGLIHRISADRAQAFMEKTHEQATIMCGMIDRLREAGALDPVIGTEAAPA